MSPQVLQNAFDRVNFDRELVFKFFTIFSLFEHALKQAGFTRVNPNGDVYPNWDTFAHAIDAQFNIQANPELLTAVNYFVNHPTKKQVFTNNQLNFVLTQRPPNTSDTEWLATLIRRVRNNLFHGGKFKYDRYRDTLLIQFSIVILEAWAELNPDVQMVLLAVQ
jgi:hypothetical protein